MRALTRAVALVAGTLVVAGAAQAADTIHVRGTVTTVDGPKVTIHTREGKEMMLSLGDNWKVAGVVKASMADIKPGAFIGTANVNEPGAAKALEVVVFPEAMRGTGEGDYGWDLKPNSQMTNATVKTKVDGVDGQTVTLDYKGGEKKVAISPSIPIVTIAGATQADIKPGVVVFVAGAPAATADMLEKGFIAVGIDGAVPPM